MNLDFTPIIPSIPYIIKGIAVTLEIAAVACVLGFILGVLLSLVKLSGIAPLKWLADFYTSVFRGTPLVLQLIIIYMGIPQMFPEIKIEPMPAAILAFSLNSAAYISEIIRGGIMAVDKGQSEAAQALGVSYASMMKDIILPQALKNIIPALINEFVSLTKETAIVTVIGALDVMRRAYVVGGATFHYIEPLLIAGVVYYIIVLVLSYVGKLVEKRMRKGD
ncbi:amino acid ABC transporter permease [Rummeliibacillus pycnus]|uniref:amino acid ABC transporter permease n=1 Tax=Rummeliibacillus pycnus TaxID=101070 RepID=UPI000C99B01F|nr:amino acid ABC transporter permease [Rummeliibacillus pycnus]